MGFTLRADTTHDPVFHRLTSTTHRNAYNSNSTSTTPRPPSSGPVLLPNAHASGSLSAGRQSPFNRLDRSYASAPASGRATPSSSSYSESPYGGGGTSGAYARSAHEVERQNDDKLEGLLGKVKMLKDVSRRRAGVKKDAGQSRDEGSS